MYIYIQLYTNEKALWGSGQEMVSFPYRAFEFYPFEHPQ